MPRTKSFHRYPREYADLFLALKDRREVRIANETATQAASLRGTLYAYMRSVEREPKEAATVGLTPVDVGQCSIVVDGTDLVIMRASDSPAARRVRAALDAAGLIKPSAELQRHLQDGEEDHQSKDPYGLKGD